jgi:hypothetical protein
MPRAVLVLVVQVVLVEREGQVANAVELVVDLTPTEPMEMHQLKVVEHILAVVLVVLPITAEVSVAAVVHIALVLLQVDVLAAAVAAIAVVAQQVAVASGAAAAVAVLIIQELVQAILLAIKQGMVKLLFHGQLSLVVLRMVVRLLL